MPLPEYRYGKVTGLVPDLTVTSERSESPMVCCGYCSAQMAARTAKAGVSALMTNEAHAIRRAGGRPHNNGNRAGELILGAKEALGVTLRSVAIDDIPQRLKDGFAVVVGIQYADLADWLKVQQNDFGHAVCLFGWQAGDQAGFFDPLWTQGARGAWTPWSTIKRALWPNGNHSTTTVRLVAMSGSFAVYDAELQSRKVADFAKGVDFYKDVELSTRLGEFSKDATAVQVLGYRGTTLAVQVSTGTPYADGKVRPSCVYVRSTDAKNIRTLPLPTTPPPVVVDADEIVKVRDAEWEDALRGGLPWPKSE